MLDTLLSSLGMIKWSHNHSEETRQPTSDTMPHMKRSHSASINRYACNHFQEKSRFPSRLIRRGYLDSVAKEANISHTQLVVAMIYSKRIQQTDPAFLDIISSSDLFLISVLVASKFLYDDGEDGTLLNSEWAKIGHRKRSAVNMLERKYLQALDWDVRVSSNEFETIEGDISANLAIQHGLQAGWFSYSDLTAIWSWWERHCPSTLLTWDILRCLLTCCTVYAIAVSTLLATTAFAHSSRSTWLPSQHTLTSKESWNNTILVEFDQAEAKNRLECSQWAANLANSSLSSRVHSNSSVVNSSRLTRQGFCGHDCKVTKSGSRQAAQPASLVAGF
ncbi:protein CNPPD1-like isoform X2 [Corticium candelabrum]|uniref:protein CNPPD1-like isoform X2 n=1 Tax=Corticium candelabrum TaxID=121492 RepID=UPI002E269BCF|nr:protein CNPPD1-like isoform X2 [Corticium candelabrum]